MVSVTQRIAKVKQPRGGYVRPRDFIVTDLSDEYTLFEEENVHSSLVGTVVDYLTRFLSGTPKGDVFRVSLSGALNVKEFELANDLLMDIEGLDDDSIVSACKLAGFDVAYRAGIMAYKPVKWIYPDDDTIDNIRIMVNRSLNFVKLYGPIVKDGFTFEGGYTSTINSGDGDFLTKDTLWDFKVLKKAPASKHTLQLLIYYLLGVHSVHPEFKQIENLGMFNPRLNKVYLLPVNSISEEVLNEVESTVIGY
jgi:hypothetical protein